MRKLFLSLVLFNIFVQILQFNFAHGSKAPKLQLRVHWQNGNRNRKINVVLTVQYAINGETVKKVHEDIKNAKNFSVYLNKKDIDNHIFELLLHIYTNPIDGEFTSVKNEQSPSMANDDDEGDNLSGNRWSLQRTVKVELFKPDLSRRYVIRLGSADSPGALFWNRRVFVDAQNDADDGGNYHAFLYAYVSKNKQNSTDSLAADEKVLLGFVPLEKAEKGEQSPTNGQQLKFTQYNLSIPVNLNKFFNAKIWFLEMDIYQYEEKIYLNDKTVDVVQEDEDDCATKSCSICLENLTEGEHIVELHGQKGNQLTHSFHSNCIKKWFKSLQSPSCPLCKQPPNYALTVSFPPIFDNSPNLLSNFYMNPLAELFRIANEDSNGFAQRQAKWKIREILEVLNKKAKNSKNLLTQTMRSNELLALFEQNFFELGPNGFVETSIVGEIRNFLESFADNDNIISNRGNAKEDSARARHLLTMFSIFKKVQFWYANNAIETLRIITEEQ